MKKYILSLLLLAGTLTLQAKSVVFKLANGTEVYYLLGGEQNPVLKYVDGKAMINTDQYEISDIKSFSISNTDDPTGIEIVKTDHKMNGNVFVAKTHSTAAVKVFAVNGTQVNTDCNISDEAVAIDLTSLPTGTYIIYVGNESFKVNKK